jgi:formylglycine-generating enzyme required for sulfatase activity
MKHLACSALTAILLACPLILLADEAADTFNKLYGDDLKRVAATPQPADDVALGKQMLEDAKKAGDQPAFLALLCEKAYELAARDPSGHATATAAMDFLAGKVPEKKVECLQNNARLYQKQYAAARGEAKPKAGESVIAALGALAEAQAAAGDIDAAGMALRQAISVATAIKSENKAAIQAQVAGLASQQQVEKQIAALKAKLDANPKDAASRKEMVRLYLVEMDNPAEAAKFVDETLDEATRKYVPAAAKPVEDAPELACTQLGDWYMGLADQTAMPASKGAMLRRAQVYYQRFLALHTAADLGRTAVTLTLKKIDDALAKLGPAPEPKFSPPSLTLDLGNGLKMRLVRIRPGRFMMGSPDSEEGRKADEGPQHEVTISKPFYMGVTEVTQAQYKAVMGTYIDYRFSKVKGDTMPVEGAAWTDAMKFCKKLSEMTNKTVRLPTEAEWEYACRAGTTTAYSFGEDVNNLTDVAWFGGNSGGKIHPVGQKKPNAFGLYDMYGNVREWCADIRRNYANTAMVDPQGSGGDRTMTAIRGGSWSGIPAKCRSAAREGYYGRDWNFNIGLCTGEIGFRVVVSAE